MTDAINLDQARGTIQEAAEINPLPVRFKAVRADKGPFMVVHDLHTSRETTVPLHAYGTARQMLNDLFN